MILLVDHGDSFTRNVAGLFEAEGADVAPVPWRGADAGSCLAADAVVLGPGPHAPGDYGESVHLARALAGRVPLLGLCLGHQILGVAFGAGVRRATRTIHGVPSAITHRGRGLFEGLPNPARFVRYHSLVLAAVPGGFEEEARDGDGDLAAMGSEALGAWGVQAHPDSVGSEGGALLARNFLRLAGAFRG
jgi:anthranilate synthase/aminodeoxychorismate synthase-like glutamine amidotransferase